MVKRIILAFTMLLAGVAAAAQPCAVVNLSVCNLRRTPDFDAEMVSQAVLGTPVHVLDTAANGWYQVQTPDTYTGWVHPVALALLSREAYSAWNAAEKAVVTALFGTVYSEPSRKSQTVSDVVGGDRLRLLGRSGRFLKVGFPDGRTGYVRKSAGMPETRWRRTLRQDVPAILATAKSMLGFPYLWAGMSPKGMDCSGFVRTVLYMHDIIIPRDASQQAPKGERIEIADDFSNLVPGDFVFFGRRGEDGERDRVSHVAIYLGNKQFIHSLGRVRINSFDPAAPDYDGPDHRRLLYASRILPSINVQEGLNTTVTNSYYNE